ncbi:type II toxin-antitoxin system VapC family toxin [Candidatus Parabeggiatoa sp. HSG14]|uniref:type II toxin-antitoxin system VapC family toxin n=1 Tax=Candidatus Parabeggiatoa sp. HSG14 TaxID=3055593 RepID=UPI0025A7A737|nr:type II toxin-antitoxin system VapC family toxin [Thiotrichales bacterium HSG14]
MTFLLDTHIWLWSLLEPDKLKQKVTEVLQNPQNELFISPITIWETLILAEKQKIKLNLPAQEWIQEALKRGKVQEIPLSNAIALKSRLIVLPHQDPADRFIAATAWEYDMTLITVDEHLRKSTQIKVL